MHARSDLRGLRLPFGRLSLQLLSLLDKLTGVDGGFSREAEQAH